MDPADLVFNLLVSLILQISDVDHHVDLIRPVRNGILRLTDLHGCRIVSVGEPDHRADGQLPFDIFCRLLHISRRNTRGRRLVLYRVVQDLPDLLPCGSLA